MNRLATIYETPFMAITQLVKNFFKGIRKIFSDPVGAFILMIPFLIILFIISLLVGYFVIYNSEAYQSYTPGKAIAPEETKHYRMTDSDYRENDKRDDIVDLEDKMTEFLFDGLDNWDKNQGGWWNDVIQNKNNPGIYAKETHVWPD